MKRLLSSFLLLLAPLACWAAPPGTPRYGNEEALRRYSYGRILEERGMRAEALEEYYRALFLEPGSLEITRRISEVAANMGDPNRSLEFAKKARELSPDDPRSLWLEGAALLNLGREKDAIGPLQAAAEADSDRVEYLRTLARAAERLDRYDLLARSYRRVVWLDDDDGESWFQLAAAEARQGRFGAADTALRFAVERNPVRPGVYFLRGWISESLGRMAEATAAYQQHLGIHPDDQAARRRFIGLLARDKKFPQAAAEARLLARARPEDLDATHIQLEMLFSAGMTAEAMKELERLRARKPDDLQALSIRVGALGRHGKAPEGIREAEEYVARHPGLGAELVVARALEMGGQHAKAATRLEAAVRSSPDSIAPRVMLARSYESAKRLKDAERAWREATEKFPGVTGLVFDLALCREKLGDLEGAEAAVRDVLSREPSNATALNFLGYLFADHNRNLDEAVDLIQKALAIDPDNGAFLDSLGWAYYRLGRLEDARAHLERAIAIVGGDPVIHEHLGDVYKDMRLNSLAKDQYRLSLSLDQANSRVREKLSRIR